MSDKKIYRVMMNGILYNRTGKLSTARNDVIRGLKRFPDALFKIVKIVR